MLQCVRVRMPLVAKIRWWLQPADAWLSRLDHARGAELAPPRRRYDEIAAFICTLDQPDHAARTYLDIHTPRIARTLDLVPPPRSSAHALELGAYMHMTPALQCVLG